MPNLNYLDVSNGNLDFYTRFNVDGSDLLDSLGGRVQVNQTLMYTHFEAIPGVSTFTTWGLTGGNAESLGRDSDWSFDLQSLGLGTIDKFVTNLLKVLDVAGSQGNTDLVHLLLASILYLRLVHREFSSGTLVKS